MFLSVLSDLICFDLFLYVFVFRIRKEREGVLG